jgi:hypothetical protein
LSGVDNPTRTRRDLAYADNEKAGPAKT